MIKYLVDSLQSYDTGHGNTLCPIGTEANESFMGEHINQAPPSTEDIQQWKMSMDHSLGDVVSKIVGQVTSPSPKPNTESALPSSVGELMPQEQFPMQRCGHSVHQPSNPYPVSNHHTSSISSINPNVNSLAAYPKPLRQPEFSHSWQGDL